MSILVNCLAGTAVGIPPECEPADTDLDSDVDVVDAAFFMRVFTGGFPDCNNNGTPDDEDIASEYSQDCNLNDVPDECDVLGGAFYADLAHRYSFEVDAHDSVGTAHGTLYGNAQVIEGAVVLDGDEDYVQLSLADTIGTAENLTLEAWVVWNDIGGTWQRIFDIGTDTSNYMFLTTNSGAYPRFGIRTPTIGEQAFTATEVFPTALTHVAVVLDAENDLGVLYIDGEPAAENPALTLSPSDLGLETIAYLGKSFWPDPYFNGSIAEFRVYTAALTAGDVADSYYAGPDYVELPYSSDCNYNNIPDECDLAAGTSTDCQPNGIPDECDIANGTSEDANGDGFPDECGSADCNHNGTDDAEDIANGTSLDCNANEIPDECDIDDGTSLDCQPNGVPDECDIMPGDLHGSLLHRWSFTVDAEDSVGDADGTLNGGATVTDGAVFLDGTDDFVSLPLHGTMTNLTSFTMEAWLILHGGVNDPRLFQAGVDSDSYLFLTPKRGGWPVPPRYSIKHDDGLTGEVGAENNLPQGPLAHLAVTYDAVSHTGQMYIDGLPDGESTTITLSPTDLGDGTWTAYLGKSTADDHFLHATLTEFRIYGASLTSQEVADSHASGPGAAGAGGSSDDNENGIPDECEGSDCNDNGIPDDQDIASGYSLDCNENAIPDECDVADGTSEDCNEDGVPDECIFAPPPGFGLLFDGATQYVDFGMAMALCELATSDFTIEMWIRTLDTSRGILIGNYNGNPSWSIELHDSAPAGHLRVYLDGEDHQDDISLADGVWHHVAVVRTLPPEGSVRILIDGLPAYEGVSTRTEYAVANPTMLARDPRPGSHYFAGILDEVRVWHVARTETQILDAMFTPLDLDPDLSAYWRLDDAAGNIATDDMGTANGTLVNAPDWLLVDSDCNENGVLDECDIADGTSLDLNGDGVPDECE